MQVTIEKLIYGGDGLGRLAPDEQGRSKTVFVPFVLPGETAEVRAVEDKPSFVRAEVVELKSSDSDRVEPACPYFIRCGGCHYQHAKYERQLQYKAAILRETLARGAKLELDVDLKIHSAEPWGYRNRTRLKVQTAPEFAIGYYRHRSHELLPVRECPISSPLINRGISALWKAGEDVPAAVREVQFFANHNDDAAILELFASRDLAKAEFERFAASMQEAVPEIIGVTAFEAARRDHDDDATGETESAGRGVLFSAGEKSLIYDSAGHRYRVSAGAFFQTNRFLVDELARTAAGSAKGRTACDMYAGAGLFSIPLAKQFERVIAVEASPYSSADLAANAPRNVKAVRATTEAYLRESKGLKADLILVDPPRGGLGENTAKALGRVHVSRVTYVSCDPSTLSRDLKVLLQSGFRVEEAHLFDLFPQTYHMESVFRLAR